MNNLPQITLPCGSKAFFDEDSGISYRCYDCFAVVGSIGMPSSCKDKMDMYKTRKILGGKDWDYFKDEEDAMD